jgi:hypothetical protein
VIGLRAAFHGGHVDTAHLVHSFIEQLRDVEPVKALLGLWGDYSLNKNRIEIQSAEMEHDVCF